MKKIRKSYDPQTTQSYAKDTLKVAIATPCYRTGRQELRIWPTQRQSCRTSYEKVTKKIRKLPKSYEKDTKVRAKVTKKIRKLPQSCEKDTKVMTTVTKMGRGLRPRPKRGAAASPPPPLFVCWIDVGV